MRKNTVWKNNIAMENKYKEDRREDKHNEGGEIQCGLGRNKRKRREEGKNEWGLKEIISYSHTKLGK